MTPTARKHTMVALIDLPGGGNAEYEIEYAYTPGDPGCRTLANGDPGYPGTGPEVEWLTARRINEIQPTHSDYPIIRHRGDPIEWGDLVALLDLDPLAMVALEQRLYDQACEQEEQSGDEPPDYDEVDDYDEED